MPYLFIVRYIRITYYYYYQSLSIYIKYSNFDLEDNNWILGSLLLKIKNELTSKEL